MRNLARSFMHNGSYNAAWVGVPALRGWGARTIILYCNQVTFFFFVIYLIFVGYSYIHLWSF